MFRNTVRILLVEDTAADATLVREALESGRWQAKITSAHSLEEARSSLKMSIPDLAIINRILPDGQGIELLPGDKESTAFPIVIVSSHRDERAEVATLKAGALDYVVKSAATLSDMPRIVERALREWGRIVEGLQAQEALIAANQRLSAEIANREKAEGERDLLFEHSIDMLAVAEIDGSFKQINPAWTKSLGWTEEELLGRPYLEFVHPDDHEATKAASAQILSARKLHGFENRYRCKDGTYKWVSWNSFALPDEGLTFAVARDITDRKRADEELRECDLRYHALFDNNHASMLLLDPVTSAIVDANPAACSFYGYSKEELTQKKISDLNTLPRDQIFRQMERANLEQGTCFHFCHRLASGTVRDVEVYSGPITVHGKGLLYSIVHDVTERKQAEEKLKETNRELDAFVYTVSHDLRTPLTPIIGYADFLHESCRDRLDDQALACLAEISVSGNKMMALMEDLLTLAKVGQVEQPVEPFDAGEVVKDVVSGLAEIITPAEVSVDVGDLPTLRVPKTLLTQIFDNLIGNAVRYAGRGGSPIKVGGERSGNLVRLYVRDHGPGIPEDERNRIFEVFCRGVSGKESPGTGVGLATVQKISRLYGGRVWVEETEGGGSTFWVEMVDVPSNVSTN